MVHNSCQCRFETGNQRSTVCDIDTVAVSVNLLAVILCILKSDFYLDVSAFSFYIYNIIMEDCCITVYVLDITLNSKFLQICLLFSRMSDGVFSGTFEGGRITEGRFDLKYKE